MGVLLLPSSPFVFYAAPNPRLVEARASDDGGSVIIMRPHPNVSGGVTAGDPDTKMGS